MHNARGFAIRSFGGILVETVSPTRRAAIVNWLVIRARRPIYSNTTDEEIERHWRECAHKEDHQCIEVEIRPFNGERSCMCP